jgi:DNA uptake protein ComE-like DNA-binding protein
MQIGNLPRARAGSRGVGAFQLARILIVMGFAACGGYALSLSVEDRISAQASPQASVAAADRHDGASAPQPVAPTDQAAPLQVADANPTVPDPGSGSAMDAAAADAPVQDGALALASVPADTAQDHAAALAADADSHVQAPESKQAAAGEETSPVTSETTGAVTVASAASDQAEGDELVNLNTASAAQLNSLRDAGSLGRAIIKGRPYAAVEDLVKRKVVRRSIFEKIKDQVTVR